MELRGIISELNNEADKLEELINKL